jgi:hypothetical protein
MKNSKSLKTAITILVILLIIILVWFFVKNNRQINNNVIENSNIILNESTNIGNINDNNVEDEINYENDEGLSLDNLQKNEIVKSPINIEGEAIGPWYFEANFSIKLIDRESGDLIAQSYVTALDDWMTEESVAFNGTLDYKINEETKALLILESANPAGLEENQMTYTMPVILSVSN